MTRNVEKNLAGMQDLLQGVGSATQSRNGVNYDIAKIDTPYAVDTIEAMQALEVVLYTRARVYSDTTTFVTFIYDPLATEGISSDTGAGFWVHSLGSTKSIVNLVNYITDINVDATQALQFACSDGTIVDWNGLSPTFTQDFVLPSGSPCRGWINTGLPVFITHVCDLGDVPHFHIKTGKMSLNLPKALITVNSTANGNTFTVADASDFEVGDSISSSFSLNYLPNSTSRIGGAFPLPTFNTVTDITGNVITVNYNVPEVIPANAYLMSVRFDKGGIVFRGTGNLTIEDFEITETGAGYFVSLIDPTETAELHLKKSKFTVSGLDQFLIGGKKMVADDCYFGERVDIAKQCIVNNTAPSANGGGVFLTRCVVEGNNRDTMFYSTKPTAALGGETGDVVLIDCTIEGLNSNTYTGSAQDVQDQNSLHLFSWPSDPPVMGHVRIKGGSIKNVFRSVFGTTFTTAATFSYKSFTMEDVKPCEADPFVFRITDYDNSSIGQCTFINCDITTSSDQLNSGLTIDLIGKAVYHNCTIKPTDILGNSTTSIRRSHLYNCTLLTGDNGEFFRVSGNSNVLEGIILEKKTDILDGNVTFESAYSGLKPYSFKLLGKPLAEEGLFSTLDWFDGNGAPGNNIAPALEFTFAGVGVRYYFGDDVGGSTGDYTVELQAKTEDLIPFDSIGYVTQSLTTSSRIFGVTTRQSKPIADLWSANLTSTANIGDSVINLDFNPGGIIVPGHKLGLLGPSDTVQWYEVASISVTAVTLTDTVRSTIANGTTVKGWTV